MAAHRCPKAPYRGCLAGPGDLWPIPGPCDRQCGYLDSIAQPALRQISKAGSRSGSETASQPSRLGPVLAAASMMSQTPAQAAGLHLQQRMGLIRPPLLPLVSVYHLQGFAFSLPVCSSGVPEPPLRPLVHG